MHAERTGHGSPALKAFTLATALTVTAVTAYMVVVLLIEDAAGDNDELAALIIIGVIWLLALVALAIRTIGAAVWVAFGAVAGLVLSPVVVLIVLLTTWVLFGWPVLMD